MFRDIMGQILGHVQNYFGANEKVILLFLYLYSINRKDMVNIRSALEKEKEELLSELRVIEKLLQKYPEERASNNEETESKITPLNNRSLLDRVVTYFKNANRFLHVKEIARGLNENGTEQISSILYRLKADKVITKYVPNKINRNTVWGSVNWVDENGEPKPEHRWKDEFMTKPKTIEI
jgi:hypothetical protein